MTPAEVKAMLIGTTEVMLRQAQEVPANPGDTATGRLGKAESIAGMSLPAHRMRRAGRRSAHPAVGAALPADYRLDGDDRGDARRGHVQPGSADTGPDAGVTIDGLLEHAEQCAAGR
jgi:hypothetical protein